MPQASPLKWMFMSVSLIIHQLTISSIVNLSKSPQTPSNLLIQKKMKWMW